MKFTEYNPNAAKNYQFHLDVVNGISEKRAEKIAHSKKLFLALVNGYDGRDENKQRIYNEDSLKLLTSISNLGEETAKRYIDAYNNAPFQDINWKVKRQLDELALKYPDFNLTKQKIYKLAKAIDDLDNPWIAYVTGALSFELTAQIYGVYTDDDFETRKKTLAVWDAEHQLRYRERDNLITIKKSEYLLDKNMLDKFGVITQFMDGWARTDTLRAYKTVNDMLKLHGKAKINKSVGKINMSDLFDDQKEAVQKIINQPISFLTGYAGTGKTYVIKKVLEALGYDEYHSDDYAVATALAGKAVKNFVDSVDGIEIQTTTIAGVRKVENYRKLFEEATTIVIDEFSMVSLQDLAFLFELNPEARYILIGDSNQLPAIGLDVLQRLEEEELLIPIKLTIPKRQGVNSGIFKDSMDVIQGKEPKFDSLDSQAYFNTDDHEWQIEEIVAQNPSADVFLTNTNGSKNLINKIKHQELLNKTPDDEILNFDGVQKFAHGDKIIVGKNNPDTGFMNGDIFVIIRKEELTEDEKIIQHFYLKTLDGKYALGRFEGEPVEFDDLHFNFQKHKAELGYAITVHKSQGSTINNVVSILGYSKLTNRNIFYTALTRAKEKHTLYMPNEEIMHRYLDTKVEYQSINIDELDMNTLEENEAIEKQNLYVTN